MARTCLVLLLLVSTAFSAFGDLIIDCGGSDVYVEDNLMVWMGDESFMGNIGQSQVVQTRIGVSRAMTTLRVFTSRTKNCYTIKSTKGQRVLARASFYYGNYDKKSAPPTFDLIFDGNYWGSVQTSLDQVVYAEISYVVMSTVTSICLAQSKANQFPFISALEVRDLGTKMYNLLDSSYALLTKERFAYGATAPIRYSNDVYDRIWNPVGVGSSSVLTIVKNDANPVLIDVSAAPDEPPQAVFATAITTPSTANSIILTSNFPVRETPVYVNLYFTEVTQLATTQKRSFQVYTNDKLFDTAPIVPSYLSVVEVSIVNVTATSKSSISLISTPASTLPPLISAAEIFYVNGPLNEGTDSYDVDGLHALQTRFVGTLGQWSGDPCLPSPYSWEWINCTSDPIPRVTELNLGSFGLSGLLPDFSSMDSLEIIDLHNNKISGPIPDFLGAFPNLKVLNLANNDFSGPIPASISKNTKLKLQVSGNPQLCDTGKSCPTDTDTPVDGSPGNGGSGGGSGGGGGGGKKKSKTPIVLGTTIPAFFKKSKTPIVLGTTIPAFFAFWAIVGTLFVKKKKRAAAAAGTTGNLASGPNDTLQAQAGQNNPLVGIIGEAVVNEIMVNIQENNNHQNAIA